MASNTVRRVLLFATTSLPLLLTHAAYAATTAGAGSSNATSAAPADNFIKNLGDILAGLGGTVATVMLIVGGIMYMLAAGDIQKLDRSKSILKGAAIGLVIVIAAAFLTNLLAGQAHTAFGG